MKRFSQRKGYKSVPTQLQIEAMSDELRASLWNGFHLFILRFITLADLSHRLWIAFFKKPIDQIPPYASLKLDVIRKFFFGCEWYEVYDFLEFVVGMVSDEVGKGKDRINKRLVAIYGLNKILEQELAGYRFVDEVIVDITSEQEIEMLEEALQDSQFEGVNLHLKRALELLSDRKTPDYRNSIKESISAVESMAKIVAENPKATLGDALKALEKNKELHPALKNGFSSLYGYTSDAGGVRHAMLEEPDITAIDAKFFLLSCTSFVNYLKSKI